MKKILCVCICFALMLSVSACGSDVVKNPVVNENSLVNNNVVNWEVKDGTITFTGNARMYDFNTYEVENRDIPWIDEQENFSEVVIADGVTYVGSFSFFNFKNVSSVKISGTVDSIGSSVFSGCDNLASVELADGIREIGMGAFGQCVSLTNINIPASVTSIGKGAFYGCYSLTDLTIPESVQVFGDADIFTGCTSLTIHCKEGSAAQAQAEKYGIPFDFNI